jgi:hypothetical protein
MVTTLVMSAGVEMAVGAWDCPGHQVVYETTVSVVTRPIGQFVTTGGQDVTV